MDRFQVIFQDPALSSEEFINDRPVIFVNHIEDKLYVKDLINRANQLSFISMQGQIVNSIDGISSHTLENGFNISNLKNGVYIVRIKTDEKIINKKILIN
jgi:tRNA U34 2-thiouridine synthase MnmA/TrmU